MKAQEWLGEENTLGLDILQNKYLKNQETFKKWLNRISNYDTDLKKLIKQKKFLTAGRTLSNRGIRDNKSSLFNCYSAGFLEDDLSKIMDTNKNLALTYKAQGGQGISFTKIRPKGTPIGEHYKSDGIMPFMRLLDSTTGTVSQGGCIHKDEKVLTKRGYIPIKEVNIGDYVWTKKEWIEVNYVFDKGIQDVYKVVTAKGYSIRTTKDHKFAVDGFNTKKLKSLKVGDKVNLISGEQQGGEVVLENGQILTPDIAYLLAHLNANGNINDKNNGGSLSTNINSIEVIDKLRGIMVSLGLSFSEKENNDFNVHRFGIHKSFISWLTSIGFYKHKTKYIELPQFLFKAKHDIISSYVSGMIDSDGSYCKNTIQYNTISKEYAYDSFKLFQLLGFFPTINWYDRHNVQRIYAISFSSRGENKLPYSIKVSKNYTSALNSRYRTPYTLEKLCMTASDTKVKHMKKIGKKDYIGAYSYDQFAEKPYKTIIFDKIESIEYVGKVHVYDLSLIEEHLFMCNGIYVSNSRKGALMQSLDIRHKEAPEFIGAKQSEDAISNANLSLEVDDEFMHAIEKFYTTGEVVTLHEKRDYNGHIVEYDIVPIDLYKQLVQNCYDWADPAILYTNRFRNYNIMEYVDEYQIVTSNPCLSGDALIQTTDGLFPIKELVGSTPDIYAMSSEEGGSLEIHKATKVFMTKKNTEMVKVITGKGDIKCTPDHKIYTTNRGWVEAQHLCKGDKVKGLNRKTVGNMYCAVCLSGDAKYIKEHRFIASHYITLNEDMDVHHCDGDGFNNTLTNLEVITHGEHSRKTNLGGRGIALPNKSLGKQVGCNWYVQKVVRLDKKEDVYDMTVPTVHNFVADGIVVHNCGK